MKNEENFTMPTYILCTLILCVLALLSSCSNDPGLRIKSILKKDHELALEIMENRLTFSSPQEIVRFYKKNFDERSNLITELKKIEATEKDALGKVAAVDFLRLESAYCEAAVEYQAQDFDMRQRAARIDQSGGNPLGLAHDLDPRVERAARNVGQIYSALANRESDLQQYGWSYIWNSEKANSQKAAERSVSVSKGEKPNILDNSQWDYVQQNGMRQIAETEKFYIWLKKLPTEDGIKAVHVAYKNKYGKGSRFREGAGEWMYVSKRQFFCAEKKMTKYESKMLAKGYMQSSPEGDILIPSSFDDTRASFILYEEICEKSDSLLDKLQFWK